MVRPHCFIGRAGHDSISVHNLFSDLQKKKNKIYIYIHPIGHQCDLLYKNEKPLNISENAVMLLWDKIRSVPDFFHNNFFLLMKLYMYNEDIRIEWRRQWKESHYIHFDLSQFYLNKDTKIIPENLGYFILHFMILGDLYYMPDIGGTFQKAATILFPPLRHFSPEAPSANPQLLFVKNSADRDHRNWDLTQSGGCLSRILFSALEVLKINSSVSKSFSVFLG